MKREKNQKQLNKKNNELKTEGRFRYINLEIEPYNLRKFSFRIKEKNELDFLNIYLN